MSLARNELYTIFYLPKQRGFIRCFDPISAFIQYKSFRINLLTGERLDTSAKEFLNDLDAIELLERQETPKVLHLFYEMGHISMGQDQLAKENIPLAISIEYRKNERISAPKLSGKSLELKVLQYPEYKEYDRQFRKGRERLLAGDCYQFNLTVPFYFELEAQLSPIEILAKVWSDPEKIGAYAHCTYIGSLNKLFLSNSPECLFQIKERPEPAMYSMPIKGTVKVSKESERKAAWRKLSSCAKEQAELYMIADLVRNDLTRAQMNPAKIVAPKLGLNVPGIVHQYSLLEAPLSPGANLGQILRAMFPGGSITGAPKKRVAQILNEIESFERGFYCGSTVILHKSLRAASINIRSCEIDCTNGELKYCAGGGITLRSKSRKEFEEAYAKMQSFLQLLKD